MNNYIPPATCCMIMEQLFSFMYDFEHRPTTCSRGRGVAGEKGASVQLLHKERGGTEKT